MNRQDPPEIPAAVFNRIASGCDNPALRFYPFCADRLIARLNPGRGAKVLDVATGTGAVALAASQAVGAEGRVMAIDLAEGMLDRLQEKIDKFGIRNIDLHAMDAALLEFRRDYFDYVLCSYGIFYIPDMSAALREWARVAKPGGRVVFTVFGRLAFEPMMEMFIACLGRYLVIPPEEQARCAARRLTDTAQCHDLLESAGFTDIEVTREPFGYHVKDETQWWDVLWNSDMRAWLEKIPAHRLEAFRTEHLAEVRPRVGEQGLWLDTETLFAAGSRR